MAKSICVTRMALSMFKSPISPYEVGFWMLKSFNSLVLITI